MILLRLVEEYVANAPESLVNSLRHGELFLCLQPAVRRQAVLREERDQAIGDAKREHRGNGHQSVDRQQASHDAGDDQYTGDDLHAGIDHAADRAVDVIEDAHQHGARVAGGVHGVGLVERAAVGIVGQITTDGAGHLAGKPEVCEADYRRGDGRHGEENRRRQEQVAGRRDSQPCGLLADPRHLPEPIGVGQHGEQWHDRREARDFGKAAGDHDREQQAELPASLRGKVRPEPTEHRKERRARRGGDFRRVGGRFLGAHSVPLGGIRRSRSHAGGGHFSRCFSGPDPSIAGTQYECIGWENPSGGSMAATGGGRSSGVGLFAISA